MSFYNLAQEDIAQKNLNTETWVDEQLIEDENGTPPTVGGVYYYHNDHLGTPQIRAAQN